MNRIAPAACSAVAVRPAPAADAGLARITYHPDRAPGARAEAAARTRPARGAGATRAAVRDSHRPLPDHTPHTYEHQEPLSAASWELSISASTPGSLRPSISSSEAPPPVESQSTRSASPNSASAAAESPPPTTVAPGA